MLALFNFSPLIKFYLQMLMKNAAERFGIIASIGWSSSNWSDEPMGAIVQGIRDLLLNPPQVIPLFQSKVLSLTPEDNLKEALKDLFLNSYSQCPVVKNGVLVGMITNNSIARWLGAQADEEGMGLIEFNRVTVSQVLKHQEEKEAYEVVSRTTNLGEVLDYFSKADERGEFLQVLFISKSGKALDPLLGIITRSDLPKIVTELSL